MSTLEKILIDKDLNCKSIWFMRQAGRYLPEFKKIRSKNKNFIKLCLNSDLSSEITLQPIKRFDLDSAIIFSDILILPYALGQKVKFIKNQGPVLSDFNMSLFKSNNNVSFSKKLKPVYEAIKKTRKKLNKNKSLIAFVGAPWTLLIYMLGLKKGKNEINILKVNKQRSNFKLIIDNLILYICQHIENQIKAGANAVQIFDSWAGLIPNKDLHDLCFEPNLQIVNFCKAKHIPVICFPKGIKKKYLDFYNIVKPDGLNLDYDIDLKWAKENLKNASLQGGMNPQILLKSDKEMFKETKKYLDAFKDIPYIFNLGHGIVPKTAPSKITKLVKFVRDYK